MIPCFITFFTMNAIPGGPFNGEKAKSAAVMQVLNERYGLDKPVGEQFFNYLKNILHGDFGVSLKTGRDIATTIGESFKVSAKIGLLAILVALIFGIILGAIAALNRNKWPDRVIIFFVTLFTAMPSFVMASFLLLIFCIQLEWVPVWSTNNPNYVLPVLALSLSPMAYITRLTKTSMLDVLGQDYIRTARAKGVAHWKVIFVHALRNSLIPVITYVGPLTASILTGSLVIEKMFAVPGMGGQLVDSIMAGDHFLTVALLIFYSAISLVTILIVDLSYGIIDPRIRVGGGNK